MIHFLNKSLVHTLMVVVVLYPTFLSAVEVRILDERGLLRAVRSVKSKAKLNINISRDKNLAENPQSLTLVSVDGVAGDIDVPRSVEGHYTSDLIAGGTWKIITNSRGIIVTSVTLGEVP